MALGAVATGSIKAHEADMVAGSINSSIGKPVVLAEAAKIGSSNVVVAKFEFNSVKKVTEVQISKMIKSGLKLPILALKSWPITSASPLSKNALAMVMPAPYINNIPHGIFTAVSQSKSPPLFSERTANIKRAPNTDIVASLIPLIPARPAQPPKG